VRCRSDLLWLVLAACWPAACFYDWSGGGDGSTAGSSPGGSTGTSSTHGGGGTAPACVPEQFACHTLCCKLPAYEACFLDYDGQNLIDASCQPVDPACTCATCPEHELGSHQCLACCPDGSPGITYACNLDTVCG
jgi:hypothetical protein